MIRPPLSPRAEPGLDKDQSPVGSVPAPGASARSVAEPVAWNSRSNSTIARAVAEKATTIPVMTSAAHRIAAQPRRRTSARHDAE